MNESIIEIYSLSKLAIPILATSPIFSSHIFFYIKFPSDLYEILSAFFCYKVDKLDFKAEFK